METIAALSHVQVLELAPGPGNLDNFVVNTCVESPHHRDDGGRTDRDCLHRADLVA